MEENNGESVRGILNDIDLNKALKFNRFFDFLKETRKFKDLLNPFASKECLVSLCITVFLLFIAIVIAREDVGNIIEFSNNIIPVILGGMFTILGLSLAGLAIVTATLAEDFITIMIKEKKLYNLISIVFNFYFSGFLIGVTIISLILALLILKFPLDFNFILFGVFFFVVAYLVIFSTIYSIMLLGTCIRLFLIKYAIAIHSKLKK